VRWPSCLLGCSNGKTQSGIQTTTYRKPTHSGLYTHWTSFIPHHQKRKLVFGLLDGAYKIASTYNAIHSEFMNIKSMLIRNGYPKAYIDRCIMKYLNKKYETSVNSFTIIPPMTTTINMRLPYLAEISYEVRREMQRFVHRYAIMPFQFRLMRETNKLNKSCTYKDKQNHLRRSSVVYKLTCTCGSNYIGQTRRNNPNQRTQIWSTFWSLQTSVGQSHAPF